jgi:dTDP-4-amino-4,6-dideoxygalactose transaminase
MGQPSAPWLYEVQDFTGNYNFTEFQAALGLSQISRLDQFVEKRRRLMKHYRSLLRNVLHVRQFSEEYDEQTAYHLCVVQIDFAACRTNRTRVMEQLYDSGIGTQVHYIPLYKHPAVRKMCGDIDEYFPETEAYYAQALSLPLYADLTEADVGKVVSELKKVLKV